MNTSIIFDNTEFYKLNQSLIHFDDMSFEVSISKHAKNHFHKFSFENHIPSNDVILHFYIRYYSLALCFKLVDSKILIIHICAIKYIFLFLSTS